MSHNKPRHFNVYKSQHLVLIIEDQPGVLLSTAPPPPTGPVQHRWLNAQALDPYSEHDLGAIVQGASDFDEMLGMLISGGFDIESRISSSSKDREQAHRIYAGQELIGTCSARSGQFTTLETQPSAGDLLFEFASLTAYEGDHADALLDTLKQSTSFDDLLNKLGETYTLKALPLYTV